MNLWVIVARTEAGKRHFSFSYYYLEREKATILQLQIDVQSIDGQDTVSEFLKDVSSSVDHLITEKDITVLL